MGLQFVEQCDTYQQRLVLYFDQQIRAATLECPLFPNQTVQLHQVIVSKWQDLCEQQFTEFYLVASTQHEQVVRLRAPSTLVARHRPQVP
jgi:hypothetical protein